MNRFFACLFILLCLLFYAPVLHGQSLNATPPKILNLDSLSNEDKDMLIEYLDSFKNDLAEVLDVFNLNKKGSPDTSVFDMDHRSHIEIGLDFASRILVNGRIVQLSTTKGKAIGLNGVGFYPSVEYYHKTGMYFALGTTFYTDSAIAHSTPVPVVSLTAGYSHTFFKRWFLSSAYSRTFNTYGSSESRKLLNNTMSFSSAIDIWKKLIFTSTLYAYWSSDHSSTLPSDEKSSIELLLSLRKEFVLIKFLGAKEFSITPTLSLYFANDNRTFVTALGVSDVKKDNRKDTVTRTQNINNFYGLLNIEPSVNIDWRIRNLDISLTPVLAVPFNIFYPGKDVRVLNPKVYRFYVQAGVKYLFCVKRKAKNTKASVSR